MTTGTGDGVAAATTAAVVLAAVLLAVTAAVAAVLVEAALVAALLAGALALVTAACAAVDAAAVVVFVVTAADPPQAVRRPSTDVAVKRDRHVRRDNRTPCMDSSFAIENPTLAPRADGRAPQAASCLPARSSAGIV
jgi:hypothetical protein